MRTEVFVSLVEITWPGADGTPEEFHKKWKDAPQKITTADWARLRSIAVEICVKKWTFELQGFNRSSRLWGLAGSIDIGSKNSELVLFALWQVEDGITGRSNGNLSVDTLPRATVCHALWGKERQRKCDGFTVNTHTHQYCSIQD